MSEFIYGAQYYRAPTPASTEWEHDLKQMKEMGLNHVKFWIQWRASERKRGEYDFSDIDCLMNLANRNNLKVTLNVIFDVAPVWLYRDYPDCRIILADGTVVEEQTAACRQLGGFPGPCYNHSYAKQFREEFLSAAVKHFRNHPALDMWDVWNEPEQCSPYRKPTEGKLSCYCPNCRKKFREWIEKKYRTIENLNRVWGRVYNDFDEAETPLRKETFADFIDYANFRLDVMTDEANMRIQTVKKYDSVHSVYLHTVPNTLRIFNSMTGVDDYALAKNCDVFASTTFSGPVWGLSAISPADGKTCYNVESHIGTGMTNMHPKVIRIQDITREFLPQIALGIKGFMYWQYRPELLGFESPAWGIVAPDGTKNSFSEAAEEFIRRLTPYLPQIESYTPKKADIAILVSRNNELLHYCMYGSTDSLASSIEQYITVLFGLNYRIRLVNSEGLTEGKLDGIKLLVLPSMYALSNDEADAVCNFIKCGGKIMCDAHLGAYCVDTGRHSTRVPGCGLSEILGIREKYTTSPYRFEGMGTDIPADMNMSDDVKKALQVFGGGWNKYFPVLMKNGTVLIGAERFACLEGGEVLGTYQSQVCMVKSDSAVYCGTNIAEGSVNSPEVFSSFMREVCEWAECERIPVPTGIRIDEISDNLIILQNLTNHTVTVSLDSYTGVYTNIKLSGETEIPAGTVDLFEK